MVTDIDKEKHVISVEWTENSETKAKVIELDDLLSVNPSLVTSSDHDAKDNNSMPAPAKSRKKVKFVYETVHYEHF